MAASLISYFCTMVTACTVLMTVMNHFSTPHMFRQPHSVIPFKHSRTAPEPGKPSGAQLFGAGQPSVNVAEAASQGPQKEKQALSRSGRPSLKWRARRHDNPEIVASSLFGQYRDDRATKVERATRVGQCDLCGAQNH